MAVLSQLKSAARSSPRRTSSARSSGWVTTRRIVSASAASSRASTSSAAPPATSGIDPAVEAITGRTGGERLLAALHAANGYVIPLDAQRHAYRHHRMFGELLRAELHRQRPERVPELHRRAARWNAEHGLPRDALRHALAAG